MVHPLGKLTVKNTSKKPFQPKMGRREQKQRLLQPSRRQQMFAVAKSASVFLATLTISNQSPSDQKHPTSNSVFNFTHLLVTGLETKSASHICDTFADKRWP